VILSDTVGFISDLPTALVAAFRATLEEVVSADLVLHVRDISHTETDAQAADVERVLYDLGVDVRRTEARVLDVWNKVDRFDDETLGGLMEEAKRQPRTPMLVSAVTGAGLQALREAVDTLLTGHDAELYLDVPPTGGKFLHWLHENTSVVKLDVQDDGHTHARVRVSTDRRGRLEAQLKGVGARLL
jgi:GTPase